MRILVFGGWGQVGSELAAAAEGRHELLRPTRADADVTERSTPDVVVRAHRPDAVVYLAAFHKVDACETEPEQAFAVNAVAAMSVAAAARAGGARCVYVSTDYVFDGNQASGYREDDPVNPLSVYGISKAAGEWAVLNACPDSLIVRASGIFGHAGSSGKGGNFVETMLAKAAAGDRIAVVDDLIFAPTCARDLAERLIVLLERRVGPGIYHGANAGSCSWYGFARAIVEIEGLAADLAPRPTDDQAVRRPRYSVLLDTKAERLGLPPSRPWRDALAWYLDVRDRREGAVA
jgi:dTDP-4-dehydrorhamnose reductase